MDKFCQQVAKPTGDYSNQDLIIAQEGWCYLETSNGFDLGIWKAVRRGWNAFKVGFLLLWVMKNGKILEQQLPWGHYFEGVFPIFVFYNYMKGCVGI